MRKIRLHTEQPLNEGCDLLLDTAAAHHLGKVLRARVGDQVWLFNGSGVDYQAEVTRIGKRDVEVRVGAPQICDNQSPLRTHLGLALSKGERFDWAVQKATELGVHDITPLFTERAEVRLSGDRVEKKRGHWQGIARSASEQCQRGRVPTIHPPVALGDWSKRVDCHVKLMLHHHQQAALNNAHKPESVALLIGPEGGLGDTDVNEALAAGFLAWRVGPRVLRTETAPVVALTALGWLWGDLN